MDTVLTLLMMFMVAAVSGLVGSFALMRRMALASDAISHVALPGLGLALLLNINPLIGGAAALILGAFLVWWIEKQTEISTETIIGVVFATSLAIGSLLTSGHELEEILFGELKAPGSTEAIFGIVAALAIGVSLFLFKDKITFSLISSDLAKTLGINISKMNLLYLLLFSVNVLLGLKFLGVLLMGALVIVPAAAAKNLAWSFNSDLVISAAAAVLSVAAGFLIAAFYGLTVGPVIISAAAFLFFASMMVKLIFSQ